MSSANRMIKKYLLRCILGVAIFCLCAQLSAKAEESSLTADIIQKTRYQTMLASNDENASLYSKVCEEISLKDIGYVAGWYRDTLSMVNDILQNGQTVGSAYNLPSRTYELNSAKVFVEYPGGKSETITLTWFLCSGPAGYTEQFSEIDLGYTTIRPNSIVLRRVFNNGEEHTIHLLSDSLDVYIYSSSGYRFNTNQVFSVFESDGSLVAPVKYSVNPSVQCRTPDNKNNVKYNYYTYDYNTYDYRLLDENNNIVDYPTDYQIIQGYIKINYKHYSSANWNLNNYNQRKIDIFYMSCFYNNRDKNSIENQQFYTVTNQYPGMMIYNISSPNYNNQNFFDNQNITYNSDTNRYELDVDSLIDGLKLALPDVDTYLKPTFDFQPSVDGNFQLPLDFNFNDLIGDIVFPDLPDVPGGGGGTVWDPPKYKPLNTSPIITTRSNVELVEVTFPTSVIKNGGTLLQSGLDGLTDCMPELVSVALVCMVFGFLWKFTGG